MRESVLLLLAPEAFNETSIARLANKLAVVWDIISAVTSRGFSGDLD